MSTRTKILQNLHILLLHKNVGEQVEYYSKAADTAVLDVSFAILITPMLPKL